MRPRALDLFSGAGGAAKGLQRAGFHVTGIDIRPQPRYCGDLFIQADALCPPVDITQFDFIWASPPCQAYSIANKIHGYKGQPRLIDPIRAMLVASGVPYVIENVSGAPLRRDIVLDGDMFGLGTHRKRVFETSFFVLSPSPNSPFGPLSRPGSVTVTSHPGGRTRRDGYRGRFGTMPEWKSAMGIDWMLAREITQAVPPAYAEFIGRAALAVIRPHAERAA